MLHIFQCFLSFQIFDSAVFHKIASFCFNGQSNLSIIRELKSGYQTFFNKKLSQSIKFVIILIFMKKAAITIALCLSIFVFDSNQVRARNNNMNNINSGFDNYKNNFVEALWKIYPTWASSVGYHKYDSVLVIPNDVNRKKELAFFKANLDSLKSFNLSELSDNNKTDYHLIENQLQSTQWAITEEKEYEWNPATY